MEILMNIAVPLICLFIGYLLGGIPNGVIIGKVFFHKDPRKYGSGGSGGTNSSRVLGKKIGILVILLDILKSSLAFWTCWALVEFTPLSTIAPLWDNGILYIWLSALGASIGHCWPIYTHFKGGKTVAVYMGATGGTSWVFYIFDHLAFFLVYLLSKKKKLIVSYASLISSGIILIGIWTCAIINFFVSTKILMWNFGVSTPLAISWEEGVIVSLIYLIMILRHRSNIKRMKNGEEKQYNIIGK